MNPHKVLQDSAKLIGERGQDYGGIEDNFTNIAAIYSVMSGKEFTAYDVSLIMVAVKMARIRQSPHKADNYHDGINYLAFAHELRQQEELPIYEDFSEEEERWMTDALTRFQVR